ncbi:MAG: tetratricopeptide repeat protein [Lachnospiraceae bacterium]|nr:tetratricopeptide repeat protein [Lachnospiraceae bacterium]
MDIRYCTKCGKELDAEDAFCDGCGAPQPGKSAAAGNALPDAAANSAVYEDAAVKKKGRRLLFVLIAAAILLVILIFVIIVLSSYGSTEKQYDRQLSLAERYLDELDYDRAVAAFRAAIEIDSSRSDAYIGLAEIYIEEGDYQKAKEVLEEGIEATEGSDKRRLERKLREVEELIAGKTVAEPTAVPTVSPTPAPPENPHDLYEAFVNGDAEAYVNDYALYAVCEYTPWTDRKDRRKISMEELQTWPGDAPQMQLFFDYIDCGLDGTDELLITIQHHYDHIFRMIVKDSSHQLAVWYVSDGNITSKSDLVNVGHGGYIDIINAGSSAYYSAGECGYLNGEGVYSCWYSYVDYGFFNPIDLQWLAQNGQRSSFTDVYGKSVEIEVKDLVIEAFHDGREDFRIIAYHVPGYGEGDIVCMDESIDSSYYKIFEDADVLVCTQAELDSILKDRRTEIGLSDEILEQEIIYYSDIWKSFSD